MRPTAALGFVFLVSLLTYGLAHDLGAEAARSGSLSDFPAVATSPTPTYPPGSSKITINFVKDGEPTRVFLYSVPFTNLLVNGVKCHASLLDVADRVINTSFNWPRGNIVGQPDECRSGGPTTITVELLADFGRFYVDVPWSGMDVTVDFDVSSVIFQPPAATPALLPSTGGQPSPPRDAAEALVFSLTSFAVAAVAWVIAKRSAA